MSSYRDRHSIRLPCYDYTRSGAYFITIVTHARECLFGEVADGKVRLNEHGSIVRAAWDDLPNHYGYVVLDAFVVMPNHIHGIIVLTDDDDVIVGAGLKPAPTPVMTQYDRGIHYIDNNGRAGLKPAPTPKIRRHGLPEIVRAFKTFSARHINELHRIFGLSVWQRNYWEHIIRDGNEMDRIRHYIEINPVRWEKDRENPFLSR